MTQASAHDPTGSNSKPGSMANPPAANGDGGGGDGDINTSLTKKRTSDLEMRAPPLPKITQGFIPMSLLLKRLVQDSFNELQLMVEGISSPGMSSEDKKARIMKFAMATRKEFIKLLVLAMWANEAAAVSNVIDLKAWLDGQFRVFDGVVEVLRQIRTATGRARYGGHCDYFSGGGNLRWRIGTDAIDRIPNPDLATAVTVLSTGQPKTGMMVSFRGAACREMVADGCLPCLPLETICPTAPAHPRRHLEVPEEHQRSISHPVRPTREPSPPFPGLHNRFRPCDVRGQGRVRGGPVGR